MSKQSICEAGVVGVRCEPQEKKGGNTASSSSDPQRKSVPDETQATEAFSPNLQKTSWTKSGLSIVTRTQGQHTYLGGPPSVCQGEGVSSQGYTFFFLSCFFLSIKTSAILTTILISTALVQTTLLYSQTRSFASEIEMP